MEKRNSHEEDVISFLASELEVKEELVKRAVDSLDGSPYQITEIKKKKGGYRVIYVPNEDLKTVQKALNVYFQKNWKVDSCLFAFVPGKSVVQNTRAHLRKYKLPRWLFKMDLKDAFASVREDVLRSVLWRLLERKYGYNKIGYSENHDMAYLSLLIRLTTAEGCLRQGLPTSPYLFNLVLTYTGVVDNLKGLCKIGMRITIYSDDIVVSSESRVIPIESLEKVIIDSGFLAINYEKMKLNRWRWRAHTICGISLNRRYNGRGKPELTLPQKKVKFYRGKINRAAAILDSGREPDKEKDGISLDTIFGYLAWIEAIYGDRYPSALKRIIPQFRESWEYYTIRIGAK